MRQATVLLAALGLSLAFLFAAISTAPAQSNTTGRVTLESKSIAIGVGVRWGHGVLPYRGNKYPFTLNGLTIVDLGISKVTPREGWTSSSRSRTQGGSHGSRASQT